MLIPYTHRYPQRVFGHIFWTVEEPSEDSGVDWHTSVIGEAYDEGEYNTLWREQVRTGVNASTNRFAERFIVKYKNGDCWIRATNGSIQGNFLWTYSGQILHGGNFLSRAVPARYDVPQSLVNRALTSFYNKSIDVNTAFQGGVFVGELGEARRMLRGGTLGLARGLGKYVKDVSRGFSKKKVAKADQLIGSLRDKYLITMFGVLPFINDIQDALRLMDKRLQRLDSYYMRTTARTEQNTPIHNYVAPIRTGDGRSNVTSYGYEFSEMKVVVYGAVALLSAERFGRNFSSLSLGLNNFLPTLYELVPYSFLLDYFSNVGDIVSSLTNRPHTQWASYTKKVKTTAVLRANVMDSTTVPYVYLDSGGSCGESTIIRESIERTRNPNLSFGLYLETPNSESLKWLNIGALISSFAAR